MAVPVPLRWLFLAFAAGLVLDCGLGAEAQKSARVGSSTSRPLIIAHRGGAAEFTENTLAAFSRALRLGADGIESDLRLTVDDVVVLYHDEFTGRVEGLGEGGPKKKVSELEYAELSRRQLPAFGEDPGGEKIPTLRQLLAANLEGILNLELKRGDRFDRLVEKSVEILKDFPNLERIVLEPPDLETAVRLRNAVGEGLKLQLNPANVQGLDFEAAFQRILEFQPHSVSISHRKVSRQLVSRAHAAGVEVWVWTVDEPDVVETMLEIQVDAIKTDRPSLLLKMLRPQSAIGNRFDPALEPAGRWQLLGEELR